MRLRPHVQIASPPRYGRRWNTSSMRQEGPRAPISMVKLTRPPIGRTATDYARNE